MKKCAKCDFEYDDAYDGCPRCARESSAPGSDPPAAAGKGWRYSALILLGVVALLVVTVPLRESTPATLAGIAAAIGISAVTNPLLWLAIVLGYVADKKSAKRPHALSLVLYGLASAFLLSCVIGLLAHANTLPATSGSVASASTVTDEYRSGAIANMKLVDAEADRASSVLSEAIALSNKGQWRKGADKLKSAFSSPAYDDNLPKPTELQDYNNWLVKCYGIQWFAFDAMASGEGKAKAQFWRDLSTSCLSKAYDARNAFKKKYGY
jgi:hypothetical protein